MRKNTLTLLSGLLFLVGATCAATPQSDLLVNAHPIVFSPLEVAASANVPFQGEWEGRFAGDSAGNIKVTVGANDIAKVTCTTEAGRTFEMYGPVEASGAVTAIQNSFGPSGIKVRFKGTLTHGGTATGTWDNPFFGLKGQWQAARKRDLPSTVLSAQSQTQAKSEYR